mgnify:CR=1 FL=1
MRFAFLIREIFECEVDRATIHNREAQIVGIDNIEEACVVAKQLYKAAFSKR